MKNKKITIRGGTDDEILYDDSPADTISFSSSSIRYRTLSPSDSFYAQECLTRAIKVNQDAIARHNAGENAMLRAGDQPPEFNIDADTFTRLVKQRRKKMIRTARAEKSASDEDAVELDHYAVPQLPLPRPRKIKGINNVIKKTFHNAVKSFISGADGAKSIHLSIDCTRGELPLLSISYKADGGTQPVCDACDVSDRELSLAMNGFVAERQPQITREEAFARITDHILMRQRCHGLNNGGSGSGQCISNTDIRRHADKVRQHRQHRYAADWLNRLVG